MPTIGVFYTDKNRVVKITCSSSEMVLRTTKHTVRGVCSMLLIVKMNMCYQGVSGELEKFTR
jgi:hypothetical protein